MSTYDIIRQAILERRQVCAMYNGKYRELCPHAIGTKNGRDHALFFQCGGDSSTGLSERPADRWRCMDLDLLADVEIIDGDWVTADNFSRSNTCIDVVDVEVAY